jgi:hypothetical protein
MWMNLSLDQKKRGLLIPGCCGSVSRTVLAKCFLPQVVSASFSPPKSPNHDVSLNGDAHAEKTENTHKMLLVYAGQTR